VARCRAMSASSLVPDDLWEAIEPLLPEEPPKPKGGRPRVPDRAALCGIVFVLRTGCPWRLVPSALGCGSGTTCWRRLRDWQESGIWQRLHETLLNWLGDEAAIDWSRASVDSLSVRAKRGASRRDRTPLTVANRARSTIWWWIGTASRWPSASRLPMPTTQPSCSRSSTPSLRLLAHEGNRTGRASGPVSCTPIRPTTPPTFVAPSGLAASPRVLLAGGSTPLNGSAGTAGWWSGRSRGCSAAAAWASATSDGQTCSRGCCIWPAP
jgi:transposase